MYYNRSDNVSTTIQDQENPDYQAVMDCLEQLLETGALAHAQGNCLAISEMLQNLLTARGIQSQMMEVKLMHTWEQQGRHLFNLVGYDGSDFTRQQGIMDTHIVVITRTPQPLLIDASVPHCLPPGRFWNIEPLQASIDDLLVDFKLPGNSYRYTAKPLPRLPQIRQQSLLDRINRDLGVDKTLRWFRWALVIISLLTVINFVMNTSQLIFRIELIEILGQLHIKH